MCRKVQFIVQKKGGTERSPKYICFESFYLAMSQFLLICKSLLSLKYLQCDAFHLTPERSGYAVSTPVLAQSTADRRLARAFASSGAQSPISVADGPFASEMLSNLCVSFHRRQHPTRPSPFNLRTLRCTLVINFQSYATLGSHCAPL